MDTPATVVAPTTFVAVNYIHCQPGYVERFEQLFATRAHAIDRIPGFIRMHVLRPQVEGEAYLVVSYWENEDCFKTWAQSSEFIEGHKRGFEDLRRAKERGDTPPMTSRFITYEMIAA